MQPINKRLENNPSLKSEYEKEGEAFNQKHKTRTKTHEKQVLEEKEIKFPPHWSEFKPCLEKLRPANEIEFHYSRCFICEKELNDGFTSDVDHYRPKAKKRNRGEAQELQYWWLAYDYRNYALLCADCNRPKNDVFPLEDDSFKVNFDKKYEIDKETPLLINPITEYHADFFRLVFILHPKTINEKIAILLPRKDLDKNSLAYKKAKTTIELYCLDMFYMEFQENLLTETPLNHKDIIEKNTQKIRNKSRLKLLFNFYEELAILAEAKNKPDFNKFWNNFKTEKPRIANLGLAHLIVLGQFEDLAVIS